MSTASVSTQPKNPLFRRRGKSAIPALASVLVGLLAMAGCAQAPQQSARRHGKEFFPEAIYGRASPKVIADGEPVPKGGGQYLVGHAYTIAGKTYVPSEKKYTAVGLASWYGSAFHGRRTANGEIYDRDAITAAHPTMPLPCYARITNLRNHRSMIVRVNDRGPFHSNRLMDLSSRAADALGYKGVGTTKIKVEYVGKAALSGSDDQKLLATLREDGRPAELGDFAFSSTRLAEQEAAPQPVAARREDQEAALRAEPEAVAAPVRAAQVREPTEPRRAENIAPRRAEKFEPVALPSSEKLALAELAATAALPRHAPLPPQRPFDLGRQAAAHKGHADDAPLSLARR